MSDTPMMPPTASLAMPGALFSVNNSQLPGYSPPPGTLYLAGSLVGGGALAPNSPQFWKGGAGLIAAVGTFASVSIQLQMLGGDGLTWENLGSAIVAAGSANFTAPIGYIRATLTSGGATTNVWVTASPTPVIVGG